MPLPSRGPEPNAKDDGIALVFSLILKTTRK